ALVQVQRRGAAPPDREDAQGGDPAFSDDEGGEVEVADGARRRRQACRGSGRGRLNRVEVSGKITELGALRFTPAGIPVVEFRLQHESELEEAGKKRKVSAELPAIAFEAQARLIAGTKLGVEARLTGFLAAKSRRSKRLVLHVNAIEFAEGV